MVGMTEEVMENIHTVFQHQESGSGIGLSRVQNRS